MLSKRELNTKNKNHWYDGLFYDYIVAPNQDRAFSQVKNLIVQNSSVIDIGCGTGRLAFTFEKKCIKIDAIDLSLRNINVAKKKLIKNPSDKINFYHSDVATFFENSQNHYDYAVLSYVIHEIDKIYRINILKEILKFADKIIIVDYLVPRSSIFWGLLNEIVEFTAGRDHYKNFKTYIKDCGIKGLAHQSKMNITREIKDTPATCHIAVLENLE